MVNLKVIFKKDKMVFFKIDGVQEAICWGAGRKTHSALWVIHDLRWPSSFNCTHNSKRFSKYCLLFTPFSLGYNL